MRSAKVAEMSHVAMALAATNRGRKNHVLKAVSKRAPTKKLAMRSVAVATVVRRIPISDVVARAQEKQRVAS